MQDRIERLQIMLSGDELVALDDFRFKQRMPSRAAAVRELLNRGLAAVGYPRLAPQGTKSSDYGVTDSPVNRDDDSTSSDGEATA